MATKETIKKTVLDLYSQGYKSWDIGHILKRDHKIPSFKNITGIKIEKFLDKMLKIGKLDHYNYAKERANSVERYREKNPHDIHSIRYLRRLRNIEYMHRKYNKIKVRVKE